MNTNRKEKKMITAESIIPFLTLNLPFTVIEILQHINSQNIVD